MGPSAAPSKAQTPSKRSALCPPATPGRAPMGQGAVPKTLCTGGNEKDLVGVADDLEAARREKAEALRHARAHRRASERINVEYQHLVAVVEQVLTLHTS